MLGMMNVPMDETIEFYAGHEDRSLKKGHSVESASSGFSEGSEGSSSGEGETIDTHTFHRKISHISYLKDGRHVKDGEIVEVSDHGCFYNCKKSKN